MTKLLHYVEEMRARLTEVADTERALVRELDDALTRLDQRLLDEVRDLTADHEARRTAVLSEMQALASRIGAFPSGPDRLVALESDAAAAPGLAAAEPNAMAVAGDWRQAVSKIDDDIENLFGRRGVAH